MHNTLGQLLFRKYDLHHIEALFPVRPLQCFQCPLDIAEITIYTEVRSDQLLDFLCIEDGISIDLEANNLESADRTTGIVCSTSRKRKCCKYSTQCKA